MNDFSVKASANILKRLRDTALSLAKPDVRIATIDRLVDACDAVESGAAADLLEATHGKMGAGRGNRAITPTTIERYVKARRLKDPEWTGPVRVTVQKDHDLRAYVEAREEERIKPQLPKKPTNRFRQIEGVLSKVSPIEARMLLRHAIEKGREAQRTLDILTSGLRRIPGIDIEQLTQSDSRSEEKARNRITTSAPLSPSASLHADDRAVLKALIDRLQDSDALSRLGLEYENMRIRHKQTKRALVKPDEVALLKKLAHDV